MFLFFLKLKFRFVVMHVILFYHRNTLYAVVNGVIFQVRRRREPQKPQKYFL